MSEINLSKLIILPKKQYLASISEILSSHIMRLSKSLGSVNFQNFSQYDIETLEELILTQLLLLNTLIYYEELIKAELKENTETKKEV